MLRTLVLSLAVAVLSRASAAEPETTNSFALIEIFTSEGCSSCPPADDYVNKLFRQGRKKELPILLLAWHVDYWNKLRTHHGTWVDPYSSPESTKRQRRYVKAVPAQGRLRGKMVTPQILIDGRHPYQFGKKNATAIIQDRLETKRAATVTVTRTETGVDWSVKGAAEGSEVLIALVQRGIKQHVKAGENHGKDLEHESVVRWHTSVTLTKDKTSGKTKIELPKGVPADSADVIAVVQRTKDMDVQAAGLVPWKAKK